MKRLPSLKALRVFAVAARHSSFQEAARELHLSPTAISHQIRDLEEQLGVALFRRRPRPVQLTPAGRQLFPALRDGFDRISSGVTALQGNQYDGPLIITTTPAFASRWLIFQLAALRAATENQDLAISASEEVVDLDDSTAHLAIRYGRQPDPNLNCTALCSDRYIPVARRELIASGPPIERPQDIRGYPLIEFNWKRQDPLAPTWDRWFGEAGDAGTLGRAGVGSRLRFSEEVLAIEAALDGHGIALVSDFLVARELRHRALVPVSSLSIDGLTFFAMYPPDTRRRAALLAVVDFLHTTISKRS